MFKSTTDIKKKRPCHTHGNSEKVHKIHSKRSEVLEGDIGNSMIRKHLPRYQSHISTQTDAIQIKSQEVKGYSGEMKQKMFILILKKFPNSVYAVKILELQEKIAEKECITFI